MTLEDLRTLRRAGVGDDVILARLRVEGVASRPAAEEVVQLKKEGVSERVLEAPLTSEVTRRAEPRFVYRYEPWPAYGYPFYDWGWWGWPYPHWNFHFHDSSRHHP